MNLISIINEEKSNPEITKKIESIILDLVSKNEMESYSIEDFEHFIKKDFGDEYEGVDIKAHVAWALDMLHANNLVKRVGPGIWQSIDGPDNVYSERSTGYAPEGEFARRGKNFLQKMSPTARKEFNKDVKTAEVSVKMLRNAGYDEQKVFDALTKGSTTKFNPVAVKVAIRKIFSLPK